MAIRREAQELWLNNLSSDDRVLVTGAGGWFGRTAIAMTRESGLEILATGSKDQQIEIDGQSHGVHSQRLEIIADFRPTVVIDTAFVTRERLAGLGHRDYVDANQRIINQSLAIVALPSVRKYIGFSSGATVHLAGQTSFSLEENPYAAQKRIYESELERLDSYRDTDVSIARVWSVTGTHVTKPESFAFTDLVSQARSGRIDIRADHLVSRRYCAVEDVLALALMPLGATSRAVFDTGGDLIELGALAELIVEVVNPEAKIHRQLDLAWPSDDYHSNNQDWESLVSLGFLGKDSIKDQIARVAGLKI